MVLDPCRGDGAFYDQYPDHVDRRWCEFNQGRDFLDWLAPVQWIITNPPWSKLREFLVRAMMVADNVVFLMTLVHISTKARLADMRRAGFGLREVFMVPEPRTGWPWSGFQLAAIHFQRGWDGPCSFTGEPN